MTQAASVLNPNIADVQNSINRDGDFAYVANLLAKKMDVLKYMTMIPANEGHQHRSFVNVKLPTTYRRQFNRGTPSSKGVNQPVVNTPGMFTSTLQMDKKIYDRFGKAGARYRFEQGNQHFEAMSQDVVSELIYGNTLVDPDGFPGLQSFYSDPTLSGIGEHVLDGGGEGSDNSDIYLIVFNEFTISGFYPAGSPGGFEHIDHGVQRVHNFNGELGRTLTCMEDEFNWDCGLEITNYKGGARLGGVDVKKLLSGQSDFNISQAMRKMRVLVKSTLGMGNACWIMNPTMLFLLDEQRDAKVAAGGGVKWDDNIDGKSMASFMGIPIAETEVIHNHNAPVTA